jgi:hypothetical protein
MAGQIEQNRADRATILRAIKHTGQHQDCADGLYSKCQRQQYRDRGQRAHSRQNADHIAHKYADKAPHKVLRLECDAEAIPEIRKSGRQHLEAPAEEWKRYLQHVGEDKSATDGDARRQ